MTLRSSTTIQFQVGQDAALTNLVFSRALSQLLDSVEHAANHILSLDAGETNYDVPFGDVLEARLIYIEADGDLNVSLGGGLATAGQRDGSGGTYPTTFAGGETLVVDIDNAGSFTTTFLVGDQTLQQVINRINAAAALQGLDQIAFNNGGQLRLKSPTTGTSSEVEVVSGTSLTTLGLTAGTTAGVNSTPGTSPIQLRASALESTGVTRYFLGSVKASTIVLDNPNAVTGVNVKVSIAGDLTEAAC